MRTLETKNQFVFGTKAETLERISGLLKDCIVAPVYYFTVESWKNDKLAILNKISREYSGKVVIRSSAKCEDTFEQSMAGAFHSCLNVCIENIDNLTASIIKVITSYDDNLQNQVLVQPMISEVEVSGVIMTRNIEDGSPYYVFNYDDHSGRTDSITAGTGIHKTVLVHRNCRDEYFDSLRIKQMMKLTKDVESVCGDIPLDIEFGLTKEGVGYLFQVRPISLTKQWSAGVEERVAELLPQVETCIKEVNKPITSIFGNKTILTTMSDWNPAEMIGVRPKPLAASLYRILITDSVWAQARRDMGYKDMSEFALMHDIFGHVYIDVRRSFNSFLPAKISANIGEKLINSWLDQLDKHPEWHDKVEFEIAQTCMNFNFDAEFSHRYANVLSSDELQEFKKHLLELTNNALHQSNSTLNNCLEKIDVLSEIQKKRNILSLSDERADIRSHIKELVEECKLYGTLPFSIVARHAFISESLLRSIVAKGVLSNVRTEEFKKSVNTITSVLTDDLNKVSENIISKQEFLNKYGHLRPGTYDATSLRYDQRDNIFKNYVALDKNLKSTHFTLSDAEKIALENLISEIGFYDVTPESLFDYFTRSIAGREYAKFVFTRNISDILELCVAWGKQKGLDREQVVFLELDEILHNSSEIDNVIERNIEKAKLSSELKLSYIIRGVKDIYVSPLQRSEPNFITDKSIEGEVLVVTTDTSVDEDMFNKVILIEHADPGFDWIFTKGIKALVTKYGGANSHMAIRCAEFGLPAAIGCGESTFNYITSASLIEINCFNKTIMPLEIK